MFVVEDGTGLPDANSYVSVQEYRDYFSDRGIDVLSETDLEIEGRLVRGTDFIDLQYAFLGTTSYNIQALQFPRIATDIYGVVVDLGVPKAVKYASIEIAKQLTNNINLYVDEELNVTSKSSEVGPIKESKSYKETMSSSVDRFKQVNLLLKPYLSSPAGFTSQIPVITG